VILPYIVIAIAAYLLGSIPVGYVLVRVFRRQDVRAMGSGNIGATNVLRTGGKALGAATFLLDVLKGSTAVWLGGAIALLLPSVPQRQAEALAALFAVLGHVFPCWLRFRGGKGVATGFGVFLFASPGAALAAIGTFIVICALTRYVSVGSIIAAFCFLVFAWIFPPGPHPLFFFAVECFIVLLIVAKHHQNIRRLMAGTESRFGARKIA
jgi:glycerol-3-phosphate acyltransferase PlsY